mmetsp:Transcript_223/g.778  ORF Transcript_223/g.778 Transcript_223/m.778 type:complete len:250 (-) Transcript_223:76-825(-)
MPQRWPRWRPGRRARGHRRRARGDHAGERAGPLRPRLRAPAPPAGEPLGPRGLAVQRGPVPGEAGEGRRPQRHECRRLQRVGPVLPVQGRQRPLHPGAQRPLGRCGDQKRDGNRVRPRPDLHGRQHPARPGEERGDRRPVQGHEQAPRRGRPPRGRRRHGPGPGERGHRGEAERLLRGQQGAGDGEGRVQARPRGAAQRVQGHRPLVRVVVAQAGAGVLLAASRPADQGGLDRRLPALRQALRRVLAWH